MKGRILVVSTGPVTDRDVRGAAGPHRPAWFRGRSSTPTSSAADPRRSALADLHVSYPTTPNAAGSWFEQLRNDALAQKLFGYGLIVSVSLHAVLLLVLACFYFGSTRSTTAPLEGMFGGTGGEGDIIGGLPDDTILQELDGGGAPPAFEFTPPDDVATGMGISSSGSALGVLEGMGTGTGDGTGSGDGDGSGSGGMAGGVRVPESAITRGSFTVWTEPEDPVPRRPYEIVIQVKLPPGIKQYRLRDLSGYVVGTDRYRKDIKFRATERKGVKDGVVQVSIGVPGADQLVKDTIHVKSDVLHEEQTIEIVF